MTQRWVQAAWYWDGSTLHKDVAIRLEGRKIAEITALADWTSSPTDGVARASTSVDLLLPGFVNAHSHAFQRAFRGWVQAGRADDDFFSWREAMYAVVNGLPPEGVQAVTALAYVEMLESGFTTVGEFHYLHHAQDGTPYDDPDELARRVMAAATDTGIRLALLRCVYAAGGIGVPPQDGQRRFLDRSAAEALAAVQRLAASMDGRTTVGIAPHSVRAVPLPWWRELAAFEGVIHAHVAEQDAEVQACVAATGMGPLSYIAEQGVVSERFTAVHLTRPSAGDVTLVTESGMSLCVCPTTELDLGDGFLPNTLRIGEQLCVGTDSHAVIDAFSEARSLEWHGRGLARKRLILGQNEDPSALAIQLLTALTRNGRRSLGLPSDAGAVGGQADLVGISLRNPAALGVPPLVAAAFVATPSWVQQVWVAGNHVVVDGRHVRRDRAMKEASRWLRQT